MDAWVGLVGARHELDYDCSRQTLFPLVTTLYTMQAAQPLLRVTLSLAVCQLALAERISYEREVLPVLATHCYECHGPDAEQRQAGLRLDLRSAATSELDSGNVSISPGESAASELLRRITSTDDDRMPPTDYGEALTPQQIVTLRTWIDEGANYEQHWAFKPLERHAPPRSKAAWAENPIDQFIESRRGHAKLTPAHEADRFTLIRRLYFDLLGLPPTPNQIRKFIEDERPDAYETLVDELLASPAYGERWGRHWLDVARYGDSNGGDENHAYPLAHRYRDYVISSFNEDLSYDRFVSQQLAGDLLGKTDDERLNAQQLTATGYLAIGMKILAEQDPVKKQADLVDEQIDTFGRTFLGLSLGCARCHDHKFDPIPTRDYYALAGIFHSSTVGDQPLQTRTYETALQGHRIRVETLERQLNAIQKQLEKAGRSDAAILREAESFDRGNVVIDNDDYGKGIGIISDPGAQMNFAEFDIRISQAAEYVVQLRYAAEKARPGQLLINGDVVKDNAIAEATGGWHSDAQSWITEGVFPFRKGVNVLRLQSEPMMSHIDKIRLVRGDQIGVSKLDRLDALSQQLAKLEKLEPKPQMVMAVIDGKAKNTKLHLRGSHLSLGEEVPRGFLSILASQPSSIPGDTSGRLQLATWLTQNEVAKAVTARVIANRVWQWHFGSGLVATPDDFGIRGEHPTHPRLLDYLASELIDHEWSMKRLSRQILMSRTYRMASTADAGDASNALRIDPQNRLYWKRNRLRLDAESIRDAMLWQAGQLEQVIGNAPMHVKSQDPSPEDMAANLKKYEVSRRRSVYLPVVRSNVYEFLTLFDFPNAASPVGRRDTTTIPTQALWMMNSPFIMKQAKHIVGQSTGLELRDFVQRLYLTLFAREATTREIDKGVEFVLRFSASLGPTETIPNKSQSADAENWARAAYCQVLMASNEYLYLR